MTRRASDLGRSHIAIVMDGNGRWATSRGMERSAGHRAGADALFPIVKRACALGLGILSVFAFSRANWQRHPDEVQQIFAALADFTRQYIAQLQELQVKLVWVGNRSRVPNWLRAELVVAEQLTSANSGLTLQVFVDYSSREDVLHAVTELARQSTSHCIDPNTISESMLENLLYQPMPKMDLVIRTSGEQRLSDFALWQSSEAVLVFDSTMWPDFSPDDFEQILDSWQQNTRALSCHNSA